MSKKSRFTTQEMTTILNEVVAGKKIEEVCLKHNISVATYYSWKNKLMHSKSHKDIEIKALRAENDKLKEAFFRVMFDHLIN